jgi:hypothetical protein
VCNPVTVFNPERVLLKGVHLGYEYEVTTNGQAVRCGYVRIPPGHPWHGRPAGEVDAAAHGGVNFAEPDVNCGKGGADDAWWLGFDCGHAWDARDPELPGYEDFAYIEGLFRRAGPDFREIRTLEYVKGECELLIDQAAMAAAAA